MTQPEIGIVIVTYNSRAEIGPCLDAALATGAEVLVVDNASSDDTANEVRRRGVRLLTNSTNRGFAAAVNQGFTNLETPFVLLLNPDAQVTEGLAALREACCLPDAAGAGGRLIGAGGHLQVGFMVRQLPTVPALILEVLLLNRIWPNNPVNRCYRGLQLNYNMRIPVQQPAGAFLMVRRTVWQELGGFDESFFPLWFEDVDFCRRAADRGYRFYYVPEALAHHLGGHSIAQLSVENRRVYWYGSLLRYSAKHFRPMAFRALCAAVVAGSLLRSVGEAVLSGNFRPLPAYGKVVRHASRCLLFGWEDGAVTSSAN
ncbi:MAG TPA: glycosyltransferase family 2 protein [Bryobacteraceae bacterium]|nr:glycosyltransferase family 2 protein [Bryobacteraceae bacterium]